MLVYGTDRYIFKKLRIKGDVNVPYVGWYKGDYTREGVLAPLYGELGYKIGAEIGVMNGDFSLEILNKSPEVSMYCIDPWNAYSRSVDELMAERRYERCVAKLEGKNATIIRKTSMDALADIPDGSLDFVYIDAMHEFDFFMMDLICWNKKVRSGGMISGHDYVNLHSCGVIPGVNAFVHAHDIKLWYITQEMLPSFFWVKP